MWWWRQALRWTCCQPPSLRDDPELSCLSNLSSHQAKKSPWESLGKLLTEEEAGWGRLREVELVLHRSGGWVGDNQVKGLMIRSKVEGSLQEDETACAKAQGINSQRVRREGGGSSAGPMRHQRLAYLRTPSSLVNAGITQPQPEKRKREWEKEKA